MADAELVVAARRQLVSFSDVTDLLGPPAEFAGATYSTWAFRWRPYVAIEGTGTSLVVVSLAAGTPPNSYNTWRFPTLQFEIQSDADRGTDLNPTTSTGAEDRARALFLAIDSHFHVVDSNPQYWGANETDTALRVVTCTRAGEPAPQPMPGSDNAVMMVVRYNLTL